MQANSNVKKVAVRVTLLPIKIMPNHPTTENQNGARKKNQTTESLLRKQRSASRAGLMESLGLFSLAVVMLCDALATRFVNNETSYSRSSVRWLGIHQNAMDYLLGGALVVAAILCRHFLLPYVDKIRDALNKKTFQASMKKLTHVARVSSGSKLSQLSVWKNTDKRRCILSASEPFVSLELVEKLSLVDITRLIQYAMECNNYNTIKEEDRSPVLKQVLEAMNAAASESRGHNVSVAPDGIDALLLCATLRIFADWRVLRQVPSSYKGYEMGMILGRRDLIQNLLKVETAAHEWIKSHEAAQHSPSLQQLLEHEVSQNTHRQLPKLQNESAAMGLLWAKRQIDYQACAYRNLVSGNYKDAHTAVKDAYKRVFHEYHGWWIQQVFSQSFRSAPPADEIFKSMVRDSAEDSSAPAWSESSCSSFDESNDSESTLVHDNGDDVDVSYHHNVLASSEPPVECQFLGAHLWDKATKHVQGEWNKFTESALALFQGRRLTTHAVQQHDSRSDLRMDRRSVFAAIRRAPHDPIQKTAHEHIQVFLTSVQPMIQSLSEILETHNMNDPTKV